VVKLRACHVVAASAVLLLGTGASAALSAPASATPALAAYGPTSSGGQIQLSASLVPAGGKLTISGSGFPAGDVITISLNDPYVDLDPLETNSAGSFSTTVTIPADTPVGYHTLTVSAATGQSATASIYVEAATTSAAPVSSSGSLPYTGTDAVRTAEIGAAAIGVGGIVVLAARRRRRSIWTN
jgi:hypothetical protein